MRIIAGSLGGRVFEAPHGHRTHPMSDKVRGGLFNSLGDISGLTVFDAFAGSGAIGFEAISRDAATVLAVENDKAAQQAIEQAAKELAVRNHKLVRATVSGWSDNNPDQQFDIVIADPPYDHLQQTVLQKLTRHVVAGGLLVLSWPGKERPPEFERLETVQANNYGDAQLVFYRRV